MGGIPNLEDAKRGAKTFLVFAPKGVKVPDHQHTGFELTVVLSGSIFDSGRYYRRGELVVRGNEGVHAPMAVEDRLYHVASQHKVRMSSWEGTLLQKMADL